MNLSDLEGMKISEKLQDWFVESNEPKEFKVLQLELLQHKVSCMLTGLGAAECIKKMTQRPEVVNSELWVVKENREAEIRYTSFWDNEDWANQEAAKKQRAKAVRIVILEIE